MIDELCNQITQHDAFVLDFERLITLNSSLLLNRDADIFLYEEDFSRIGRLLQVALTLALSKHNRFRKMAYDIAVMCNNLGKRIRDLDLGAAIIPLVFTRLGNFPAEQKFCSEHYLNPAFLPTPLWFEQEAHRNNNTIKIAKSMLTLTDFQLQLWESVNSFPVTIVNAPTSTGKSFILQNHIIKMVSTQEMCAVYIVPTRALIEQVMNDLRSIMKKAGIDDITVSSIPEATNQKKSIYVLTQERTQLLLENDITIDVTVIDEAQNVSDSARGIILQSVVETIKRKNYQCRFIFATPFVQNPDLFLSLFSLNQEDSNIIPIGESPVSQNLFNIYPSTENTHLFNVSKLNENGLFCPIGTLSSQLEIANERHTLAILALEAGKGENNIIYGNEPTKCEEIAQLIAQQLPELSSNEELIEFSDYLKEHIHNDYLLADIIRHGVAYHYGRLPAFIRKEIERLCSSGSIKYLVCTSTLLQGVNLPTKNIFISKPTKGSDAHKKSIPMRAPDFWNLAGRAGRLTKDFEGNVFLLNLDTWEINPINAQEKHAIITPTFRKVVCDSDLCEYIRDKNHKSGQGHSQGFENAFMKLYFHESVGQLESTLDSFGSDIATTKKEEIINLIRTARRSITLPDEIVLKNPSVSVYRQQALFNYFKENSDRIERFVPPHPLRSSSLVNEAYLQLFRIFNHILANNDTTNNSHLYYYWFALDWMKGISYKKMLEKQISYKSKKRKRGQPNANTEARNLFDSIETKLRFDYVKFSKCYTDILAYTLNTLGKETIIESIPPLHLYLELGASSKTMINLIGLGLSRTAAGVLSEYITNAAMSRDEVLGWLRRDNVRILNLPYSIKSEIKQII